MSGPLVSVICPTIGRDQLVRTLASVRDQAPATECELIVVGDTHSDRFAEPLERAVEITARYEARYVPHDAGMHMVGQGQRNYGMTLAQGDWLAFLADDDIWTPGAWAAIQAAIVTGPRVPCICRVNVTWAGMTVWQTPQVACGNLDANGLLLPRDPARLGVWGPRYTGDFDMAVDTIARWNGQVRWIDSVISIARPPG